VTGARRAGCSHRCGHIGGLAQAPASVSLRHRPRDRRKTCKRKGTVRSKCAGRTSSKSVGTRAGQRDAWQAAAQAAGLPLASWLREAADAVVLTGVTAADLRAEIIALRTEIGRGVGNNLNQLARALHTAPHTGRPAGAATHAEILATAARDLAALRQTAEALLRRVERGGQRGRR
jgi:Bacterial mobilisation protein (MobC)